MVMCTGYIYPDDHVSLLIRARANRIIRWASWEPASWLLDHRICGKDKFRNCLRVILADEKRNFCKDKFRNCLRVIFADEKRNFGKDKFRNCLRIILADEMRKFGKDKFRDCLRIILAARIWLSDYNKRKVKESFASGNRIVDSKERVNKMGMYRVYIPGYGAIERSSNRRAPEDGSVCCRIISLP